MLHIKKKKKKGMGCGIGSSAQLAVNQPNTNVSAMGELMFQLGRNK